MMKPSRLFTLRVVLPGLLTVAAMVAACGSDGGGGGGASDAGGEAGSAGSAVAGRSTVGGADAGEGGAPTEPAGAGGAGGASGSDAGSAGEVGAGGAQGGHGDCYVALTMNTSNALSPEQPLNERCQAITYSQQMNFEVYAGEAEQQRNLKIDFFESPVMGASIDLSEPFDFAAGKGGVASYMDAAGVWNADQGIVTIEKVEGEVFTVTLKDVHFIVLGGGPVQPTNTGAFVANGTITAMSMAAKQ